MNEKLIDNVSGFAAVFPLDGCHESRFMVEVELADTVVGAVLK